MGNKYPQTIIMDQCQTMMNAIEIVFPKTRHRLCQWHIKKNAPSYFGSLNNNVEFRNLFKKLMKGCESEAEFEDTWNEMITNHGCHQNSWLNNMYKLRDKWSIAFNGDDFNVGLKATSRSESANHVLKEISDKTTSLYNFVIAFEGLVMRWRAREKAEDFSCKQGKPTRVVKHSSLLIHAANVYTNTIYRLFEYELMNGTMANSKSGKYSCGGTLFMFEVVSQETNRVRTVSFDMDTMVVKCNCKKFESTGILCGHALLVLTRENVHEIPLRYISRRWTKDVKNRVDIVVNGGIGIGNVLSESEMVYSNQIMRFTTELVEKSKQSVEAKEILIRCLEQAASNIDKLNLEDKSPACQGFGVLNASNNMEGVHLNKEMVVFDPPIKSKGVPYARPRSFWEKGKNKKSRSSESSRTSKPQANKELQASHQSTRLTDYVPTIPKACEQDTFLVLSAPSVLNQIHTPINPFVGQQLYEPI
ncbi:hypothetical protein BUALT_Bualt06G0042200 [Buddleja alternifolia]|uniref:SWIM-type domain-containing protein n=1 Tax=Buddleja alternifolia TaxID=168488 RepID=A0AAV6XH62_9LAMI|nr:hypothetical protein BUALT_Bualt06G0042200 [Buddleja alternifolia]